MRQQSTTSTSGPTAARLATRTLGDGGRRDWDGDILVAVPRGIRPATHWKQTALHMLHMILRSLVAAARGAGG